MSISVCIPTHNREADLARTLGELRRLDPPPLEIVVLLDGCTDGSRALLEREFPEVRRLENAQAAGCVVGRNQLMEAARGDIVLGIDDDSYPLEDDFLARLSRLFAERPRLAVASFPQRTNEFPETLTATDFGPSGYCASYVNCASAMRRAPFLELGGYYGPFFHMYDEPDYSLRLLAAGWQIFHDTSFTIRHHYTPVLRSEMRNHHRHARNELWSVLLRCPAPQLPAVALFRLVRQFGYAWKRGLTWCLCEPQWWADALRGASACLAQRHPIQWRTYYAWMRLMRQTRFSHEEWESYFGHPSAPLC